MVSGQVLADKAGHLQHVEARHREHRLQRTVGLDDPPLVELVHRTEMCHGDDARDVNPVEINLVEEELRHTAGCDARNPSPFGGQKKTKAEKSNPKSGPQAANPVESLEKLKSKLRHCTNTGGGVSKVLRSQTCFPKAISHRYRYAHRMHTAAASTILYFWHAQRSTYKRGAKGSACLIGRKV